MDSSWKPQRVKGIRLPETLSSSDRLRMNESSSGASTKPRKTRTSRSLIAARRRLASALASCSGDLVGGLEDVARELVLCLFAVGIAHLYRATTGAGVLHAHGVTPLALLAVTEPGVTGGAVGRHMFAHDLRDPQPGLAISADDGLTSRLLVIVATGALVECRLKASIGKRLA